MEDVEYDDDTRLPPLTPTPRYLTAHTQTMTSQPVRSQTPSLSLQLPNSSRRITPEVVTARETPRRSLRQICRGHRQWTTGLCSCGEDISTCFFSCICPCYIKWSIAKYLGESRCLACIPGSGVPMRTKVRAVGGIQGSIFGDMFVICCCPCLGISQTTREVDQMIIQPELYVKPVPS